MSFRLIAFFLLLVCWNVQSQNLELSLTKIEKDSIIKNIGVFFKQEYIFPEKGMHLQKKLMELNVKGEFDGISDPNVFRRTLQKSIRNVIDDKHIIFIYRDPKDHQPFNHATVNNTSNLESEYEHRKEANFGIPELKILEKNIGYMKITKFTSPELFTPVVRTSSEFLKNVDGLIMDLRSRGGGHSEAVVLLLSYFLPPNTAVFNWENRAGQLFERNWTLPTIEGHYFGDIPIMILTSEQTFSGSEAFAYIMKHHNKATLIGETTRGGAHSYKEMYPSEKYLILVPHQRVYSTNTGQNWEGNGVVPAIQISALNALNTAHEKMIEIISRSSQD